MSGAYGGCCYREKPAPECHCGRVLNEYEVLYTGMCELCFDWEKNRERKGLLKVKACKVCGHSFQAHWEDAGCCSQPCRQTWNLQEYHSAKSQRWFVQGWGWLVLDVMQQVFQELYPAPAIVHEGCGQMPMYNTFCVVPAVDRTLAPLVKSGKMPKRRNLFTQHVISSYLVMDLEDQNERAWDHEDRRRGYR